MAYTSTLLIEYRLDVGPTVSDTMNKQYICVHYTNFGVMNIISLQSLGSEAIEQATQF